METSAFLLAALAGALTTLSPCVLPVLPLVVAASLRGGRTGPFYFGAGLLLSFVGLTWTLARFGSILGLDQDAMRFVAGLLLVIAGLWLWSDRLQEWFASRLESRLGAVERASRQVAGDGQRPGAWRNLGLGALTGLLWTPCSGPSLGVALGLAAERETALQALGLLSVFGVGALVPLLAMAYGSRSLAERMRRASRGIAIVKKVLGTLVVLVGLGVLSGTDKKMEAWLVGLSPEWLSDLTTKF